MALALIGACATSAAAAVNPDDPQSVRDAYAATLMSNDTMTTGWPGSVAGCNAGSESHESAAATIADVNFFREMNRLAPVALAGPEINAKAQAAALMFEANAQLSHAPPSSWACFTAGGAEAAGRSNIALGISGPATVGAYVDDAGTANEAVGHRRWILYPKARVFGSGATSHAQALWVIDSTGAGTRPASDIVSWPPSGYVPWPVVYDRWSISSNLAPTADYSQAQVSVTAGGVPLAVTPLPPHPGYGDNTLVFQVAVPPTLRQAGTPTTFDVAVGNVLVNGVARSLSYRTTAIAVDNAAAPTAVATNVSAGAATIAWQPPAAGAADVIGYRVAVFNSGGSPVASLDVDAVTRSTVVPGLADGTYRAEVRALTSQGANIPASRMFVVGMPSMAVATRPEAPPARMAPALRGARVLRTRAGRVVRVSLLGTTPIATRVERWQPARGRWVATRRRVVRGLHAGVHSVRLGRFGRGRYRVVVTAPRTDAREGAKLALPFAVR